MNLFSNKNSKLKKDSIWAFGLPAKKTCPSAGECRKFCYASKNFYLMPSVQKAQSSRLALTKNIELFKIVAVDQIKKNRIKRLRIHDSGDFYNAEYLKAWLLIIQACQETHFYAYTKQVSLLKAAKGIYGSAWPNNFRVIYSFGGKQDSLIDIDKDRHAMVFDTCVPEDYADGSESDLVALEGHNNRIGLVKH